MHFLDIIIFALITFFFIQRLKGVLGQPMDVDHQADSSDSKSRHQVIEVTDQEKLPVLEISDEVKENLSSLMQWDKNFSINDFYNGAVKAFQMILKAYTEGRTSPLEALLNPNVFKKFSEVIEERRRKNLNQTLEIVGFLKISIEKIQIENLTVSIDVRFLTEQTNVIKDHDGNVVEGTPNLIEEIEDIWTFQKEKNSSKTLWKLADIRSRINQ